ncbi:MAG: amidohydrolase family protein [Actinomycetota bacterium]|nr:amidohydrolase family protein [Actinomycetota bacterium]
MIDPERPIVDPHHHLWRRPGMDYLLEDLRQDTGSGHNVEKTVFVECRASYRESGPEHLRPVGETEFVAKIAADSKVKPGAKIAGIVAHADLTLGESVEEVLNAHEEAGQGLFRGIRHAGAHALHPEVLLIPGRAPANLFADEAFRNGVRRLGQLGYTYESWHYHYQLSEFTQLARSAPETAIILDHFGTPLGVGPYESERKEIFSQWKHDIRELAECPNVVAKLGGLAMPDNGFNWHLGDSPATADQLVDAQGGYYLHAIECFGPDRCMFESNFPVDRLSVSYRVLYNAFKKIASGFSEEERTSMFRDTASRIYRI